MNDSYTYKQKQREKAKPDCTLAQQPCGGAADMLHLRKNKKASPQRGFS
ncbi:hypothetical protein [Ralstonia sp. A12]|nr:hypothetical protein [Ralstonia sp. A12]